MPNRKGDWIQTYRGIQFWPLDPRPEEIDIVDIAHALSNQCRFSGHCLKFYSVAEHSIRVCWELESKYKLWGLLHDASEAYLVDLPRPIKRHSELGTEYKKIESNLMTCICQKFGLDLIEPYQVREADDNLLMTEARDIMSKPPTEWGGWTSKTSPLPEIIVPWSSKDAKQTFLDEFQGALAELTLFKHAKTSTK